MTTAVLFDIDGTLLDSIDLHAKAWQEAFQHFGHKIPLDELRQQIGKGGDQLIPMFLHGRELEEKQKPLEEFRSSLFKRRYLAQVKPFPAVREIFLKVKSRGQQVGLASSAKKEELNTYEEIANIRDLVEVETSSGDVERSKPHPDIFEAALDRLKGDVRKEDVVVVGDSPHDAEASKRAGLRCVGVLSGGFSESTLKDAGCLAVYASVADLLQHYDESPLAANG
jgi:HAD superfamily hydrolase (TIGR01549 family)